MRAIVAILLSICPFFVSFGQTGDSISILLNQGASLHDKGDFEGAIRIYDNLLEKDANNYLALYEKTLSLYASGKFQDCIDLCQNVLKRFPKEKDNRKLYINYGSALDGLGKPGEAISAYSEGIKKFPDNYLLYFNRGITEYSQKEVEKATKDFEKSVSLNPVHGSSHLFLAQSMRASNKIAAAMSLSVFLVMEPEGKRATEALKLLSDILGSNVKKKDEKNIVISLSPDMLDTKSKKEDDFHLTELTLSLQAAVDLGDKKGQNIADMLSNKLEAIAEISTSGKKNKQGFFTAFYVPFFKQMNKDSLLLTAAYVMHSSSDEAAVKSWLEQNKDKVDAFYKWLKDYAWLKDEK